MAKRKLMFQPLRKSGEVIHHLDGDPYNHELSNLAILPSSNRKLFIRFPKGESMTRNEEKALGEVIGRTLDRAEEAERVYREYGDSWFLTRAREALAGVEQLLATNPAASSQGIQAARYQEIRDRIPMHIDPIEQSLVAATHGQPLDEFSAQTLAEAVKRVAIHGVLVDDEARDRLWDQLMTHWPEPHESEQELTQG